MSQETDWGKYSGGQVVDATLLNIRRERRCEFIGEGMRWDDLVRWRSMDHLLTKIISLKDVISGMKCTNRLIKMRMVLRLHLKILVKKVLISLHAPLNTCVRMLFETNNDVYDGYTWQKAHYLNPVPVREMELLSPDEKAETSVLYQNPYWSTKIGEVAEE
ncbi:RagB/SusD family nutrient uptake outer membrane protein [Bacteroides fragilis]